MQAHGGQPRRPSRQDTIDLHDDLAHEGQGYQHYDDGRYGSDDEFHTNGVSVMEDEDDQEEFMDEDDRSSVSEIPDPSIDFDLVYSLHTFVATVEGQANVAKGDSLFLMDDSNSYWWLVRVLKSQEVGYIPAENIETPYERLARLNKHRNVDLASATQQERTEDTKSIRDRDRRQRYGSSPVPPPKSVIFGGGSNQVFNYPPAVWNSDEYEGDEWDEDEEGDEYEEAHEEIEDDSGAHDQSSNGKVNPADFDPDDGMSWEDGAETAQKSQQRQGDTSSAPGQEKTTPGAQQAQLGLGLASTVRQGSRERLVSGQSQQSQQSQDTARGFDPENITETRRVTATPAIARDASNARQNGNETAASGPGLQLAGQGQSQAQQRASQEDGKRSREDPSDSENGDGSRKRGKDNRSSNGDRKLRKERTSDGPDTDGEGSGKESKDKDKKKKGGVLAGLFGRGKKDKKEKDNGRRPISSQDSEISLATRGSDDSLSAPSSYTTSPPETAGPIFAQQRRSNSMDPKRNQPSNGQGGQASTSQAATLRMQRADQEQQARFHQSFSRTPSSPPDPALAFGTQSAATQQLRNLHASTHNGRPGSLILLEGNQPLPELSVLRVFAGERVESEATFKTVLVNADTTSTKLVHQAMQRFRLANAEDPSEYYLTVKSAGGAEAMLQPDEHPLLVFEAEQARAPTVKRSSVGSINSIASNLSAMPAIAKLGNDFADDSAVKFYLNRKPSPRSGDGLSPPQGIEEDVTLRAEEIYDGTVGGAEKDDDTDTLRGSISNGTATTRPHLSVSAASQGSVPPERFTSPSARFSVQVVIYPEDLPEGMVFDPHTEAIVPRTTLQHRSQSGIVASPGISQTQRRKVLNFPKNTTVAEVIEASLERFGILEGVVEGGDDVEEKMTKRRSHSRVRYGLAVLNEGQAERDLLPSSKVLDAFTKQPIMRVIDRRSADAKRRSADSAMLLASVEDIQREDPVFILRRVAGARNSIRSSTSRYSAPLDELALQQLAAQRESVSDASVVSDKEPQLASPQQMTPKEIIAAQRAASRANQRAIITTQANSERGVDVLLPDRATLRSTRARTDDRMRYSYVLPDGEAYDISDIVERELRGNQSPSGTRAASTEGGDLLEGVLETPRNVMEEKLDRVLNKIRDDKSNGRLGINLSNQSRQSPSGTSRSSHHRHGSDSSPRLGSSPHQDSDASHYYNGRSPVTPPTTVEARGPSRPVLLRDNFGLSELMAVVELSAALRKPAPRPGLSPVDELLFGPSLTIGEIHPSLRDIYEPTFREMQDVDRQLDELLHATFRT
ncbi:unnamed protein product [Rhizoctonia solani]|uniref:Tip elongation aberrant protein Tea4 n=1 Tax=Rhizoctonia solani TaxID=456999 RepID=A0A8H2XQT7_9AGAM|nr:unnamed protein product [Rhizoctonia solani]